MTVGPGYFLFFQFYPESEDISGWIDGTRSDRAVQIVAAQLKFEVEIVAVPVGIIDERIDQPTIVVGGLELPMLLLGAPRP